MSRNLFSELPFIGLIASRFSLVIFKVYDSDGNGRVAMNDMLEVLRDLTGQFISQQQREVRSHVVAFLKGLGLCNLYKFTF